MKELADLVVAVRDEIQHSLGRLSCIHAVGTLIDVADSIGYKLEPITVRGRILNPFLAERVGEPTSPEFSHRLNYWSSHKDACQVGLGIGDAPAGEWAGHLVAIGDLGDGKKLILDPTLQQVDKPAYDIILMPLALRVDASRLEGKISPWFKLAGCGILYQFFPDDLSFRGTNAWRESRNHLCAWVLERYYGNRAV